MSRDARSGDPDVVAGRLSLRRNDARFWLRRTSGRLYFVPAIVVGLWVALGVQPGLAASSPSPSPSPTPQGCQLVSPQPTAPLTLNLVGLDDMTKAVMTDTETFECYGTNGSISSLKDVELFLELVDAGQRGRTPGFTAQARSVETHTCTEDLVGGGVSCQTTSIPLQTAAKPLAGCGITSGTYPYAALAQPAEPTVSETAVIDNGLVRTVTVTNQVLSCGGNIGELFVFGATGAEASGGLVRVARAPSRPPTGFSSLGTQYDAVLCLKNATTATVVSCDLFTPSSG